MPTNFSRSLLRHRQPHCQGLVPSIGLTLANGLGNYSRRRPAATSKARQTSMQLGYSASASPERPTSDDQRRRPYSKQVDPRERQQPQNHKR
jgi:hypothetical protein